MQLPIDNDNWMNYIINVESELKHRFKILKNEEKISEKESDSICLVCTTSFFQQEIHQQIFC